MMKLHLKLLGGFSLVGPSRREIALIPRKARALLAYIALQPQHMQSRHKVAGLLWEYSDEQRARNSLRQTLFAIRQNLKKADALHALVCTDDVIQLNPESTAVDVSTFECLASRNGTVDWMQMIELYSGDLLDGINTSGLLFDEWLTRERERLRNIALDVLARFLSRLMHENDLRKATHIALRLLAINPLDEECHRTLMRIYASQKQYGLAIKQFRLCSQLLNRELDVRPEQETLDLYRQIIHKRCNPCARRLI
jgi:DNA-binding SARP family transcriptional activator